MMQSKYLQSAFFFAVLLNMKHIFIYASPVYIAFLLKFYCWNGKPVSSLVNLIKLGLITIGVTALSFGPFYDHIPQVRQFYFNKPPSIPKLIIKRTFQVLSRLFPFKRGLCHAYWAPNFWTLYNIADKVASVVWKAKTTPGSNTGGLVQEFEHQVLPSIKPMTTFILTGLFMVPCVIKIFTLKYDRYA